jgi:hypothetical protein
MSSWQSSVWSANRAKGGYGLAAVLSSKREVKALVRLI